MQCFAGVIFVLLLTQNSGGNEECGPEQENLTESYRRLLNEAESQVSEDGADPENRMGFLYNFGGMQSSIRYYKPTKIEFSPGPGLGIFPPMENSLVSFHSGIITNQAIINLFHTIQEKADVSVQTIMQRLFNLFGQWPEIKFKMARTHTTSFRDVLRVMLEVMYPEWDVTKLNMIFSGSNIEAVLRELFIALFPKWPKSEVQKIFSPVNDVRLILKSMLEFMIPQLLPIDINYIFGKSGSLLALLQRLLITILPEYPESKVNYLFGSSIPVTIIIERLMELLFSQPSIESSIQIGLPPMTWTTEYQLLFPGMHIPTYLFENTAPDATLTFLLSQLNNTRTMPNYSYKRDDALLIILCEWLKMNPQITYLLTKPGEDDFYNFKSQLFPNVNGDMPSPWEFRDEGFLKELFNIWRQFIIPKFPSSHQIRAPDLVKSLVPFVKHRINPTSPTILKYPGSGLPGMPDMPGMPGIPGMPGMPWAPFPMPPNGPPQPISGSFPWPPGSPGISLPIEQTPRQQKKPSRPPPSRPLPTTPPPTSLDSIPSVITDNYILNLGYVPQTMKDMLLSLYALPNKEESFPIILNLLADGSKPDVQNNMPGPKLFELLLRLVTEDWPDSEIRKVVDKSPSIKQTLKNLWTTMFLNWPNSNYNTSHNDLNSPKQVLELFIRKALPQIPGPDIDNIFNGPDDMDTILDKLFVLLFPNWPDFSGFFSYFDPKVLQRLIKEIAKWPKQMAAINSRGKVSIPILLESLLTVLFPTWTGPEISTVVSTRVPQPLIIQNVLQLLTNGGTVSNVELPASLQSSKMKLPFDLFKAIFPHWPDYTVPSMDMQQRSRKLSAILHLLQPNLKIILQTIACLQTSEHKWIVDFIIALINYILQSA